MSILTKLAMAALVVTTLAVGGPGLSVREASAAPLSCTQIDSLGRFAGPAIADLLDAEVAGERFKISRRKSLVVRGVRSVSVDGCRLSVVIEVTLKRKWRRDAKGTVTARADLSVDQLSFTEYDLEFDNIKVAKVSLSNTLGIGEKIYRRVANAVLPNNYTYHLDL